MGDQSHCFQRSTEGQGIIHAHRTDALFQNLLGDYYLYYEFLFRIAEADAFFAVLTPVAIKADTDRVNVMRQALAGMLLTKQYFYYDIDKWLKEHHISPEQRHQMRNGEWFHMLNDDIISMPDKWEYPHKRQLKDSNVIPAGIAGIQMPWMARLTSTSMCSGCRHKSVWNRFALTVGHQAG